ncbi:MAG: hypothetical protein BWK76_04545 [Desulfobulbaceae bacterium A2]|nr:MAG: hypothetical protein BWK76_04545 [Desulfobulbaceae bacterium A2]
MTVFKGQGQLAQLLDGVRNGTVARVYLVVGERFLCRQAAEELAGVLLAAGGTLYRIDGEEEDPLRTLGRMRTASLLPGRQLYQVTDSPLFSSRQETSKLLDRVRLAHREGGASRAVRPLRTLLAAIELSPADAQEENLTQLSTTRWQTLFACDKPADDLSWLGETLTQLVVAGATQGGSAAGAADHYLETLAGPLPAASCLLLLSEVVDKRTRLYKFIKEQGVVLDLEVEGSSKAATQRERTALIQDLVRKTLAGFGKTMSPPLQKQLLERVGFHPVAAVLETEKLALAAAERKTIEAADLEALLCDTRQEAIYELTEALGRRDLDLALRVQRRLLDQGFHALAIVATIRNQADNLLRFRSLIDEGAGGYRRGIPAETFQRDCLPALKARGDCDKELGGHPFAVYSRFRTAENFSLAELRHWLELLFRTEQRLKGSPLRNTTVLDHLLCSLLAPAGAVG